MRKKTDKHFLFEVSIDWLNANNGAITAKDVKEKIHVALPAEFGGDATLELWSPEHLFLSSIASCFMTTYLVFAKKFGFNISSFSCNAIGQIEVVNEKYKFTIIDLYPNVFINSEALKLKATMALEKTHKYCLITNSLDAKVFYHSQIIIKPVLDAIIKK